MDPVTLADYQRGLLRTAFRAAVARGEAQPLLLLACAVPSIVVPAVFLAVAGRYRVLQPLRYALAAALVAYNLNRLVPLRHGDPSWVRTSSINFASAYGAGLVFSWGTFWALVVLVWTDPWDGERVARRRKRGQASETTKVAEVDVGTTDAPDEDIARSLRLGHEYYWQAFPAHASFLARFDWAVDLCLAWRGVGWSWCKNPVPHFAPPTRPHTRELVRLSSIPDETKQGYRRHRKRATFYRARLVAFVSSYLVLDVCAVLMTHDPHFIVGPPPSPNTPWSEQVDQFLSLLGADQSSPPPALIAMPPYLEALYRHPHLLALHRSLLGLAGMLAALHMFLSADQMARVFLGRLILGENSVATAATAAQLWHYPSIFGSVSQVLDHGLAGFWGSTWHQTFRGAFVAPTQWLIEKGVLPGLDNAESELNSVNGKDGKKQQRARTPTITRLVGLAIAFGQSAILHSVASVTTLPTHTQWWGPTLFFLLSGVGIIVQAVVLPTAVMNRLPLRARQAANVLFTLGWLHATVWLFIDDTARCGLWLFEPVPFSVVRWVLPMLRGGARVVVPPIVSPAGSSRAGHAAWRWYRDDFVQWHNGRHWWESGLAI